MLKNLDEFKTNFENRFNLYSILDLGEDSVRYDFFISFMNSYGLQPHDIQMEYPVHPMSYLPNNNPNSKREENPQIDLFCSHPNKIITAEFGLFKRNSNPDSSINETEKVFKMLNDMLRLSLNKINFPSDPYFVCIADSKILGKQMRKVVLPPFPSLIYSFDYSDINEWIIKSKSAKSIFDPRFSAKAAELKLSVNAKLIFNQRLNNPTQIVTNNLETRVLVYKIDAKIN